MSCSAVEIAAAFLEIAERKSQALSPMKLQKLVYFAHGWFLAITDGDSLIREPVEAWEYGPVISSIYHKLKRYGAQEIDTAAFQDFEADPAYHTFLEKIWGVYGGYSGSQLSNLSHAPGSPWAETYNRGTRHKPIPNSVIQKFFKTELSVTAE